MKSPWTPAALVLVATLSIASCGLRGTASTTDDVAKALVRQGEDASPIAKALREANGGSTTLDEAIAGQLTTRAGVVDDLWKQSSEVRGLACDAYSQGADQILSPTLSTSTAQSAQGLLDRMRSETEAKTVTVQTLKLACDIAGALEF